MPANETLVRVCVVSRDPALIEEVHKDLLVGFSTRGGYEFESDHPDFQLYCDVLFVDLRAAGVQGDGGSPTGAGFGAVEEGLAFIQAIRQSVSHPPIVALCDAESVDFGREVMQHGAYDKLTAPLNMSQLRLALQRAYEFRLAETKLESFLTAQTVAHDRPRNTARRKAGASMRAAAASSRPVRRARPQSAPSRLALGFVLGGVVFFAGLVAVRTVMSGMGDALAGSAPDSSGAATGPSSTVTESRPSAFAVRRMWPLTATADFSQGGSEEDSAHRRFHPGAELALPHSSLPGYEPAAIIERVSPRYSLEARSRHLQGTVRIRAVIGKDGVPRGIARVSGDPTLAQIAMDAVALWRYAPATIDGDPVESEAMIPIDFKLPD
jgi:TonB family protein